MGMSYQDILAYQALTQRASASAQDKYYSSMAAGQSQQMAMTAAQNAFQNALATSQLSGYFGAGVGNGTVAGQATMPNIQYTTGEFGQMYPGGFNQVAQGTPTQAAIQNQQQFGLSQAGVTGVYYDPGQMTYTPGTFIRDPTTNAIGQIQSDGRMKMFGDQGDFLRAGGSWDMVNNPDMMRNVSTAEYNSLANDPGANFGGRPNGTASLQMQQLYGTYGLPTAGAPTMAMQAMYGSNAAPYAGQKTSAQQQQDWTQAQGNAQLTGMYYQPQASQQDNEQQGKTLDGKTFAQLPADQQQAYLSTRSSPQQAAADWARDANSALLQSGYQAPAQQGTQTLDAQNQYFNQAQQLAGIYGQAYDPLGPGGTAGANSGPAAGTQTLAAQQQYWNQAYQQSQANQTNTLAYLSQLANLRGPADWAKYQQVLGSTPQGMRDLYAASMGQYIPGGGATTGVNPQAATLQTQQQQIAGQGYGGQQWGQGGYANGYTTQPGQPQTPQTGQMQNAQWTGGQQQAPGDFSGWGQGEQALRNQYTTQQGQGSGQVWGSGVGMGWDQNTPAQNQQATGNGTNTMGYNQQYNLPAPNQISAQAWGNFTPSQQQMMLGMYEANGWDKNDVQALYNQSLPKYGSNQSTAGTWRMT